VITPSQSPPPDNTHSRQTSMTGRNSNPNLSRPAASDARLCVCVYVCVCVCSLCYTGARRTFFALYYIVVHGVSGTTEFFHINSYLLPPWSRVLLENVTGPAARKNFPTFLKPESSSPYSQVPATCTYPEPTPSSPHKPIPLPEDPF